MHPRSHNFTLALLMIAGISFALMQTLVVPALPFFSASSRRRRRGRRGW